MDIFSNVFLKILHTVPVDRFIAVDTSEIDELGFSSTRFLTVSMFSSIFFCSGKTWKIGRRDVTGGHESVDNSGKGVTVKKLTG